MTTRRRRVTLTIAACLLAFGLAEIGWRIYVFHFASDFRRLKWSRLRDIPDEELRYRPHPYLPYVLNPGFRGPDGTDRHNEQGFRGEEVTPAKPAGAYRIACIGGSSSYGTGVNDYRLAYPNLLQRELRETHGRAHIEVLNAGVPGYTSWELLTHVQLRVLDVEPDLLVIYVAVNDVKPRRVPPEYDRSDASGYRKDWPCGEPWWDRSLLVRYFGVQIGFSPRYGLGYWFEHDYPGTDIADAIERNSPIYFRRNLESIVRAARAAGANVVFASWSYCDELAEGDALMRHEAVLAAVREHNELTSQIATAMSLPYFEFAAQMPREPRYWADSHHVNAEGARIKARLFAEYLEQNVLGR